MPLPLDDSAIDTIDYLRQHQRSFFRIVDEWATKHEELLAAHEECLKSSPMHSRSLPSYRLNAEQVSNRISSKDELCCPQRRSGHPPANKRCNVAKHEDTDDQRPHKLKLVDSEDAPATLQKVFQADAMHFGSPDESSSSRITQLTHSSQVSRATPRITNLRQSCTKYVSEVQKTGGARYNINKLATRENFDKYTESRASYTEQSKPNSLASMGTADFMDLTHNRINSVFYRQGLQDTHWTRYIFMGSAFQVFCAAMIFLNVLVIAIETEYEANTLSSSDVFERVNTVLTTWFSTEMCLKLYAYRTKYFTGSEKWWNYMDVLLVSASVFDSLFAMNMRGTQNMARTMRLLRLIRLFRNIRLIRYMTFAHDFKKMFMSLLSCMGTLFWAIMMLASVTWSFAVVMVQLVVPFRIQIADDPLVRPSSAFVEVSGHFQNTSHAMYCMIQSITAGINWGVVSDALFEVDAVAGFLYVTYLLFTIFGVLNIVTSVFVDSALSATEYYRELIVERKKREKESYAQHVLNIFKLIDEDQSGLVTLDEVEHIFNDPQLEEFIHALEVNPTDAAMLFKLLDFEGNGMIDAEMFTNGCLKLKGEAKSFDVYCLIYENERNLRTTNRFMVDAHMTLKEIRDETQELNDLMSGIRKSGISRLEPGARKCSFISNGTESNNAMPSSPMPKSPRSGNDDSNHFESSGDLCLSPVHYETTGPPESVAPSLLGSRMDL